MQTSSEESHLHIRGKKLGKVAEMGPTWLSSLHWRGPAPHLGGGRPSSMPAAPLQPIIKEKGPGPRTRTQCPALPTLEPACQLQFPASHTRAGCHCLEKSSYLQRLFPSKPPKTERGDQVLVASTGHALAPWRQSWDLGSHQCHQKGKQIILQGFWN